MIRKTVLIAIAITTMLFAQSHAAQMSEDMVKDWQEEINRFEGIHQEEVVL